MLAETKIIFRYDFVAPLKDCLQISILKLIQSKRINQLLIPPEIINSFNIRGVICRRSLNNSEGFLKTWWALLIPAA